MSKSKLTADDYRLILEAKDHANVLRKQAREISARALSRKFHIHRTTLMRVLAGEMEHEDAELLRACMEEWKRLIRELHELTEESLGRKFNVSSSTIGHICRGRNRIPAR